jgi:hypothetical protein
VIRPCRESWRFPVILCLLSKRLDLACHIAMARHTIFRSNACDAEANRLIAANNPRSANVWADPLYHPLEYRLVEQYMRQSPSLGSAISLSG